MSKSRPSVGAAFAGRAYAAYGGVYIACSILWLLLVEKAVPDRWDILGALWLSLTGREGVGVKPFIGAEIGQVLNDTVAQALVSRFRAG